jgi:hypothetical protein
MILLLIITVSVCVELAGWAVDANSALLAQFLNRK